MSTPSMSFPFTPAQQEASRHHERSSHDFASETGTPMSRLNATRQGLNAHSIVLAHENEGECQELIQAYEWHYQPVSAIEVARVHEMALSDWRLRRVADLERGLLDLAIRDVYPQQESAYSDSLDQVEEMACAWRALAQEPGAPLTLLMRYQTQLQRSHERSRMALLRLRAEREQQQADRTAYESEHPPVLGTRLEALRGPGSEWPAPQPNEPEPAVAHLMETEPWLAAAVGRNEPEPRPLIHAAMPASPNQAEQPGEPSHSPTEFAASPVPSAAPQPNEPKLTRQQRRRAERVSKKR